MLISKTARDKFAVALGASLDWYDFALYGFFASVFAKLFFPSTLNQSGALIYTFGIWFAGFAARPFGALIFGYIGDTYGRILCFKITSVVILLPALIFPLLPTYTQIGIYAPVLVIIMRVMQGVCIGAEFAGNMVYLCETSPKKQNYFYGSLGSCTGSFGILMASVVASIVHVFLTPLQIEIFGWRIAFSIGIILAMVSFVMRRNILETRVFTETIAYSNNNNHALHPLKIDLKSISISCGVVYMHATSFYMIFIFFPTFLNKYLSLDVYNTFVNNSFLLIARICIIPLVGILADKIGGRKILLTSCLLFIIFSYPLFYLISLGDSFWIVFSTIILALFTTLNAGTVPGLLVELIPPEKRYSNMSIAFNVGFGIFGGIVPLLSVFMIEVTHQNIAPAFYLMFSAIVTGFILVFFIKRPSK